MTKNTWSSALEDPAIEFPLTPLKCLEGKVPIELQGTLYRNGPGRLSRGNKRVGHWFDGDGAVLAVHFKPDRVEATYRYVQTEEYLKESQFNRFLYLNYGTKLAGPIWNNWGKKVKNSANTSVIALPERLLALWEGGNPHALDLQTLETKGIDDLNQSLKKNQPYSAHPKIDPLSGEIYNFGVSFGPKTMLNLYRSDCRGLMIRQESYQLEGNPLIHDFVVAGSYLIFFIAPVEIAMWPVLLGMSSFCEAMHWRDEKASQILIFERENLTLVARGTTDAWFAWHFANGCQTKDGNLLIEVCRYSNFKTNQFLKEVATGSTNTLAKSELWQIVLNPLTAKVISDKKILSRHCEFPIVPPKLIGQPWQLTYLSLNHEEVQQGNELLSTIGSYDRNRDELQLAPIPKDSYACEPIYVLNKSDYRSSWLVTIVYNGLLQTSEVQIFKASNLKFGPLCRLELPQIIPPSFHGTWKES